MKSFLTILSLCLFVVSHAQRAKPDTVIDKYSYKIVARFKSGKVKQVGNFTKGCSDTTLHKFGKFITFNEEGKKKNESVYYFDKKICRRFLGLKQGRWGAYGHVEYYFLGIVIWAGIVDPCF